MEAGSERTDSLVLGPAAAHLMLRGSRRGLLVQLGQVVGVGNLDLGDAGWEVASVVGDESVGADGDRGSQVGGICCAESVKAAECGSQVGDGAIHGTQVEAGQQCGQRLDLVGMPVAQRLAEYLGKQQQRPGAIGWIVLGEWLGREQRGHSSPKSWPGTAA